MESEAQKRANKKWKAKNKAKQRYYVYRSATKTFITSLAKKSDLKMIKQLLAKRLRK